MITTKEMHAPQTSLSGQVTYKNVNYAKECSSFIIHQIYAIATGIFTNLRYFRDLTNNNNN